MLEPTVVAALNLNYPGSRLAVPMASSARVRGEPLGGQSSVRTASPAIPPACTSSSPRRLPLMWAKRSGSCCSGSGAPARTGASPSLAGARLRCRTGNRQTTNHHADNPAGDARALLTASLCILILLQELLNALCFRRT